jgi:hypothetical protein
MSIDDPSLAGVQVSPACRRDVIGIIQKVEARKDIGGTSVSLQAYGDRRFTGSDTTGEFHTNLAGQSSSFQGIIHGINF